jgi:diguanylate cyclase (GGDEF)-like protein
MNNKLRIFDRRGLILALWVVMAVGFMTTSLLGYYVSKRAIREAIIGQDLPLTSSNIYSEIQKDLVRPVLISSTMASDTFLRDWVLRGEKDVGEMARYLKEVKSRYGAFSSFFVSDKTGLYYTGDGVLKRIQPSEPRDAWYYRVRDMKETHEINVDPDLANKDALTIFINYRVFDFSGNYIGVTGVGLTVDAVRRLIVDYQRRFNRTIYFVDGNGKIVLFADQSGHADSDLRAVPGLGPLVDGILRDRKGSFQYEAGGDNHILNVNYLSELKWYLFVEQNESSALAGIRKTLYVNLAISLAVTIIVVLLIHAALARYQSRIEDMASTDKLTGLLNRHAFTILIDRLFADYRREQRPMSVLLADIDHFKAINDRHGHLAGDVVLQEISHRLRDGLRGSDLAVRWGGEEFLILLRGCELPEAERIAENLRRSIEATAITVGERRICATISIGVAQYDGIESDAQLIDRADAGLYQAKNGGRNRVALATGKADES